MSIQKPTSSARKLENWKWIRELDRAAMVLIRQGVGVPEAYRRALQNYDPMPGERELASENVVEDGGVTFGVELVAVEVGAAGSGLE